MRPAIQKVLKDVFVATSTAKEAAQRLQNYALDDPRLQTNKSSGLMMIAEPWSGMWSELW